MKKFFIAIIVVCLVIGGEYVYSEIYTAEAVKADDITFDVFPKDVAQTLGTRLEEEGVIRNHWFFTKFVAWKKVDTNIQAGSYTVQAPITLARVVEALSSPIGREEKEITIIPGWTLREVAAYFEQEGIASEEDVFDLLGQPAVRLDVFGKNKPLYSSDVRLARDKPVYVSFEGYLAPDTYRIFDNASLEDVVEKLILHQDAKFTDTMYKDITQAGRTPYEVLTIAGLLEREVQSDEDMARVADLFWRRYDLNWALQSDASVKYILGLDGSVFTSVKDRDVDSPWNTYKYPGLPLGPISNPSTEAIQAAIYPEKNEYWYFLTTLDTGEVKYGRTLEEHNANVARYLR